MRHVVSVGQGKDKRDISVLKREGSGPSIVWLGGFRSDMRATKAEAIDRWAAFQSQAYLRFDYFGHGASEGDFEKGTISHWLEDSLTVIQSFAGKRPVLVGSSMGGWLALLATQHLLKHNPLQAPSALVLIAPAVDFTETLMWERFSPDIQRMLIDQGFYSQSSEYSSEPYKITKILVEDGRKHLMLDTLIKTGCPIHILQGMRDMDVPCQHALRLMNAFAEDQAVLTLVKDGDHRLSTPANLDLLIRTVELAINER